MKKIFLEKVKIQNFLSIGNDPIEIEFKKGLHVITGVNKDKEDSKNGVGKSTLADAIFYGLFGQTLRELEKDHIVNKITKRNCKVTLEFNVDINSVITKYKIVRSEAPSSLKFYIDGIDKTRTKPKTNAMIEEIIGTNPTTIQNSDIMSLNSTVPFLAQKGVEKKKFIEGIFQLSIFGEMQKIIRDDLNNTKNQYELERTKIEEIEKTINTYILQQKEQQIKKEKGIKELEERKIKIAVDIDELTKQLKNVDDEREKTIKEKIKELNKRIEELSDEQTKYIVDISTKNANKRNIQKLIDEISKLGNVCITCKRPYPDVDLTERKNKIDGNAKEIIQIDQSIIDTQKIQEEIKVLQKKCKDGVETLVGKLHELDVLRMSNKNILSKMDQLNGWSKQIDQDIEKIQKETDTFKTVIDETKARLDTLNAIVEQLKKDLKIFETAKYITSDEGVKSYIVNKMLKLLNSKLSYYLKRLDTNCFCIFNEYFDEKIKNEKQQDCSYNNFSNGERKRIDLGMLFTFMDIRRLQSTIWLNVSIYDELLDTSLDQKGINDVLSILKEQVDVQGKAVYVISHKSEAIKHATGDIIYLEKENGITRRKEYAEV
jgi:DNA repair exonuclease SbcCD ATPase subunit